MRFLWIALAAAVCQAQQRWPYLTYFGGLGSESIRFVSSDGAGGSIVAGETFSIGPPFSDQPPGWRTAPYVFVARFDAAGQLIFMKVLGDGSLGAMAVDADSATFVAGSIRVSSDFATPGVFQSEATGTQAFVAKISSSGEKQFATYFGTQGAVQIRTMAIDAQSRPLYCGAAIWSSAVPLTSSTLFPAEGRNPAGFCAQLTADGASLVFSTLLGKPSAVSLNTTSPATAALDMEGNLVVAGSTAVSEFGSGLAPQSQDRRRSIYWSQNGEPYQSAGGTRFGTVMSVQTIGNDVFVGTQSSGVWTSPDGGGTWRQFAGAPFSGSLSVHPAATRFMCVAFLNQVSCSQDGGSNWQFPRIIANGLTLVPDPRVEGGFFVTTDQPSRQFTYLALGSSPPATNLQILPQWLSINSSGDRILAITDRRLMVSEDRGATFRMVADNIARVAAAPGAPQRLYAARAFYFSGQQSIIIRSDDGGANWTDTALDETFSFLREVVVDPSSPDIVYVVAASGAYRSTNAGASWELWTPPGLDNVAVQTIHFDGKNRVWVGTAMIANGFLLKLRIDKPAIVWGTLLGGAGGGSTSGIRLDAAGRILFTGSTLGFDLPVTGDDHAPRRRAINGIVGRYEATGELGVLRYAGVAAPGFDRSEDGSIHLAVTAIPADLGAVEETWGSFGGGASDVVWLVLSPELDRVVRATWLGGSGADTASAISAGADGKVRLVGSTVSRNLPVSADALQREFTLFGGEQQIGGEGFLAIAPQ